MTWIGNRQQGYMVGCPVVLA